MDRRAASRRAVVASRTGTPLVNFFSFSAVNS
jgi:hypothetical protein